MDSRVRRLACRLRPGRPGRRSVRFMLLVGVPLVVVLVAGGIYLTSGRYVETENAYVRADMVAVTPEVSGNVQNVAVGENQAVAAGELLFRIDPEPYRIAVERARSALAEARSRIETMKASYRETAQELAVTRSNADYAEREYQRQAKLAERDVISASVLDRYAHGRAVARKKVVKVEKSLDRLRASLAGDPDIAVVDHPQYREAKAALEAAQTDLANARVTAPFAGITAKTPVPGQFVSPGKPAMSLVANDGLWVEANLKETQLTNVRDGQPVEIELDAYPQNSWRGRVQSIAAATGSEFSVLPAENATGNWVKVVQRVPVRIAIEPNHSSSVLRSGLSANISVDTGWHQRGPAFLTPLASWMRGLVAPAVAKE